MEVSLRPRQRPVGSHVVAQTSEDRSESVDLLGCQSVEEQSMHQLDVTRCRRVQSRPARLGRNGIRGAAVGGRDRPLGE